MIITFGSIRGAPGATSWSLLLAAAWPIDIAVERVVLEADPAGGVLGARYGWGVEPGVVSLASKLRRTDSRAFLIEPPARRLGVGFFVIPGPEAGEQAHAIWRTETDVVARRLDADFRVWFVDAGRLEESSPTIGFSDESAMTLLVCGGRPEDLVQIPARVGALVARGQAVGLLVTGECKYNRDELADFTGVRHVWSAKHPDNLIEAVGEVLVEGRTRRRSLLWRRALEVASDVAQATRHGRQATEPLTRSGVAR